MKKFIILIIFMNITLVYGQNTDWSYVMKSNGIDYYFKPKSYNTAWTKEVSKKTSYYSKNVKKFADGYVIIFNKFDCSDKKMGIGSMITYTKDGKILSNFNMNEYNIEMSFVVPDSVGETLLNSFCAK